MAELPPCDAVRNGGRAQAHKGSNPELEATENNRARQCRPRKQAVVPTRALLGTGGQKCKGNRAAIPAMGQPEVPTSLKSR